MTTTAPTIKLTGFSLVEFVNNYMPSINNGEKTRTDMIMDAGYVYDNGKAQYVEFYTELLRAKGVAPVTDTDILDSAYEDLNDITKALYDKVDEAFGEKWDHEEVLEFINELDDIGITSADEFEGAYYGRYDSSREFAQEYAESIGLMNDDNPLFNHVDWDSFARELEYDFGVIEFAYEYFYFHIYW